VSRFPRLRAQLRQHRHHRAFRIAPPATDGMLIEQLERLLAEVRESAEQPRPQQLDEKLLLRAATKLWEAQRRLARKGEAATEREQQTGNYLRTCREALTEAGLVIQDHDGDYFHPGRLIEEVGFEKDPALEKEIVLRTVRPTIYLHGRHIQTARVIVAGPPRDAMDPPAA
jgi:hypothetical protein